MLNKHRINATKPKNTDSVLAVGILLLVMWSLVFVNASAHEKQQQATQVLAPGYRALEFKPPEIGSYVLPVIANAGDGAILTSEGKSARLHDFLGEKLVLLSFIYTHCDDVNGCPLATYVTSQIQNKLLDDKDLKDRVRFISVSFDPENDSPKVMREFSNSFVKDNFDWQFLTTGSNKELAPILKEYGQSIIENTDNNGKTETISHILRVFLIDEKRHIRSIYSTSFLHTDSVLNDIKTLAIEDQANIESATSDIKKQNLHGAGDNKQGYSQTDYQTQAASLTLRHGGKTDLIKFIKKTPLGLPKTPDLVGNTINEEKIELGRDLFYDRRLSHNNTISCAMCHVPEQGFTSNELATSVGIEGRTVKRNAPTLYNVAYAKRLFHDARENALEQQIWSPLLALNEMGNPSVGYVIDKIKSIEHYRQQFSSVFNGQTPNMGNVGEALASYERALVSANSAFDRWHYGKQENAINSAAAAGYEIFTGKAACASCHRIEKNHALFTDDRLHNTGVGYLSSMQKKPVTQKIQVAPGTWVTVDNNLFKNAFEAQPNDLGHYEVSNDPQDRWKYRTPTLRNIALTAPYMHNGSMSTLREVVDFYNAGGIPNQLLDPLLRPLNLSEQEINQLLTFLNTLTGDNIDEIISDAFAAPVGNTR